MSMNFMSCGQNSHGVKSHSPPNLNPYHQRLQTFRCAVTTALMHWWTQLGRVFPVKPYNSFRKAIVGKDSWAAMQQRWMSWHVVAKDHAQCHCQYHSWLNLQRVNKLNKGFHNECCLPQVLNFWRSWKLRQFRTGRRSEKLSGKPSDVVFQCLTNGKAMFKFSTCYRNKRNLEVRHRSWWIYSSARCCRRWQNVWTV